MDQRITSSNAPRRMAEISHLFLSEVREKQTAGAPRPTRTPPGAFRGDISMDLTPEEFAEAFEPAKGAHEPVSFKPIRAILANHLGESMQAHVREFAGSLCGDGGCIGIVYANAANIRIARVDGRTNDDNAEDVSTQPFDLAVTREVLTELNSDVSEWLIVLPDPRDAGARSLLKQIQHWTLITGVDHDSIVGGYRTIKGLAAISTPTLNVAIFGAETEQDIEKTRQKLAGVCEQFLHLHIDHAAAVKGSELIVEHTLLDAAVATEGAASPWSVLQEMAALALPQAEEADATLSPAIEPTPVATPAVKTVVKEVSPMKIAPAPRPSVPVAMNDSTFENIIDLPDADTAPAAIVQAILKGGNDLVESPIKAPAHADAIVAVSRDHHLVLIAVARPGLADLRSIATAYRWMSENRSLISMALPQFAINTQTPPQLRLMVDHIDATADLLQPLLASGNVSVQAYRKLRWGTKTGLLLEAA